MRRLRTAVALDLRVQARYRFPQFYLVFTLLYVLILRLPLLAEVRPALLPILLFSEPGMLGLIFAAAQLYFETDQGTTTAVAVSPLRPGEFVLGKAISIGIVATVAGLGLFGALVGTDLRLLVLTPLLFATAMAFGLLGVGLALRFSDLTRFLFATSALLFPVMLPVLPVLGLVAWHPFLWLPSAPLIYGAQLLIESGESARMVSPGLWLCSALAAGWAFVAFRSTAAAYARHARGIPAGRRLGR